MKPLRAMIPLLGGIMISLGSLSANEAADQLRAFLKQYQQDYHRMYCDISYSWWEAAVTGSEEAFAKSSEAQLALSTYHSDAEKFRQLRQLIDQAEGLTDLEKREAHEAYRAFEQSQFPPELMKKMIDLSTEIEQIFQTQRATLDGEQYTNNELLEMLEKENDSQRRYEIWCALKQVGPLVAPKLVELAKVRNEAAHALGYKNYWEMSVSFQDYDPAELTKIFDELITATDDIYAKVKGDLDEELKARFGVDEIKPWHYDNPFFQQAPPSSEIDPNIFYEGKTKEDIVAMATAYYDSIGLETRTILANSDLFEKPGKSQHGFCNNMNLEGDVRILCNIKPTAEWQDTQLHELGHSVYDLNVDQTLPYNLRGPAHIFTTEGIAMMFGALARDPDWLVTYAGVDREKADAAAKALRRQRLREQLIFCRFTIVMFQVERALYENPDADISALWWDKADQIQKMPCPERSAEPDWASKPHFVIAPVYYHNYMLGELFASQLRQTILKGLAINDPKVGALLTERVFAPGDRYNWKEFVRRATGEEFSPKAFAYELEKEAQ